MPGGRGPGGPRGPMGGPGMGAGGFGYGGVGPGRSGIYAKPGPIRGAAGYANGGPTAGRLTIFDSFRAKKRYAVHRYGKFRGFFRGTWNWLTQPFHDLVNGCKIASLDEALKEKRITKEVYNSRIIRIRNSINWKMYKDGEISLDEYNAAMDKEERDLGITRGR